MGGSTVGRKRSMVPSARELPQLSSAARVRLRTMGDDDGFGRRSEELDQVDVVRTGSPPAAPMGASTVTPITDRITLRRLLRRVAARCVGPADWPACGDDDSTDAVPLPSRLTDPCRLISATQLRQELGVEFSERSAEDPPPVEGEVTELSCSWISLDPEAEPSDGLPRRGSAERSSTSSCGGVIPTPGSMSRR